MVQLKHCTVCTHKRLVSLLFLLLFSFSLCVSVAEEREPLRVIFPSAGIPYVDELTIVTDEGYMTTAPFPLPWDMLGNCLRIIDARELFGDTFQNMRYPTEDRGYGLVMKNQMIAFQHDSAGAIALTVEQMPEGIDRLELEIGGFTRLSLETMPEKGDCLYLFYGIGGAEVTLNAYIITDGGEAFTPDPILLRTVETEPQPASLPCGEDEVKLSARFVDLDAFLSQMPLTNPVPTGIDLSPIALLDPSGAAEEAP